MTTINLQATVQRFAGPCTVHRYGTSTIYAARVVQQTPTDIPITGYVSPVPGHIQRTLPESIRESISAVLWTTDFVQAPNQATGVLGDDVTYNGQRYNVREVKDRVRQGEFYACMLQRLGTVPNA